jgi:hypothetical protein
MLRNQTDYATGKMDQAINLGGCQTGKDLSIMFDARKLLYDLPC